MEEEIRIEGIKLYYCKKEFLSLIWFSVLSQHGVLGVKQSNTEEETNTSVARSTVCSSPNAFLCQPPEHTLLHGAHSNARGRALEKICLRWAPEWYMEAGLTQLLFLLLFWCPGEGSMEWFACLWHPFNVVVSFDLVTLLSMNSAGKSEWWSPPRLLGRYG